MFQHIAGADLVSVDLGHVAKPWQKVEKFWRFLYMALTGGQDTESVHACGSYASGEYHICKNRITESLETSGIRASRRKCKSKKTKDDEMRDFVDGTAFNFEQGNARANCLPLWFWPRLDDAIADDKKYGNGPEQIARWARSRDGREVLSCAGIDPNERVVNGLMALWPRVRTSVALSAAKKANAATMPL
jgi:hypothetical protein